MKEKPEFIELAGAGVENSQVRSCVRGQGGKDEVA